MYSLRQRKYVEFPALSEKHQLYRTRYINAAKKIACVLRANKKPSVELEIRYANAITALRAILRYHGCYPKDEA